ncbi:amidohydrolase family protein [Rubritalea marina]|uniref:amidohydrolase family protein n=1 Tax=Rubritalea marina TaxID=361055 RepID=UPI000367E339|nr:amidohydrolase family protein [Rubritalea marina]
MIDSHHHLWNYTEEEFSWIEAEHVRRSFLAPELDTLLEENQVDGAVAVQARCCLEENDFLLQQADQSSKIKGVVGWADLKAADVSEQLAAYAGDPRFVGVREITQGAADEEYLSNPDFDRGVRALGEKGLVYDVLIFQNQLDVATAFIDRHPEQQFVLDHGAKPEIRAASFPDAWEAGIRDLAKREHLVCKISGLVTEVRDASWDETLMRRYLEVLLESFGPQRLMFGSDWPVSLMASSYKKWKDCVTEFSSSLSIDEQEAIHTETATKIYRLTQ